MCIALFCNSSMHFLPFFPVFSPPFKVHGNGLDASPAKNVYNYCYWLICYSNVDVVETETLCIYSAFLAHDHNQISSNHQLNDCSWALSAAFPCVSQTNVFVTWHLTWHSSHWKVKTLTVSLIRFIFPYAFSFIFVLYISTLPFLPWSVTSTVYLYGRCGGWCIGKVSTAVERQQSERKTKAKKS